MGQLTTQVNKSELHTEQGRNQIVSKSTTLSVDKRERGPQGVPGLDTENLQPRVEANESAISQIQENIDGVSEGFTPLARYIFAKTN